MEGRLHVSIPSWEVQDHHVVFNITTMPPEGETYSTKRRYREFERLNRKFKANSLPEVPLPGKLFMHSDSAIEGRRVKLERALKSYVQSYGLNAFLEEFLLPRSDVHLHSSRASSMQGSVIDESIMTSAAGADDEEDSASKVAQLLPGIASSPESEDETLGNMPIVEAVNEDDPNFKDGKVYPVWALEMLAARASFRAERSLSFRLARIYTLATVATLLGSLTVKANRWPLVGAAIGSAVSAGFALLNALWLSRKEDWRRRGLGLDIKPSSSTDGIDAKQLADHLEKRLLQRQQLVVEAKQLLKEEEEDSTKASDSAVEETKQHIDDTLLERFDDLHASSAHDDILMAMQTFADLTDSRLAWRWARATYYQTLPHTEAGMVIKKLDEVLVLLRTSADKETSSLTHKWIAIVHNAYGERKGSIKDRVEAGLSFEFHTKRALEIDPNDPTLHYMSGRFCFDVSGLSWIERQGAKAIAGKEPPKATYQDALRHYQDALALKASPAFYLEIGRCYQKLKDESSALDNFKKAADFQPAVGERLSIEEEAAAEEAKQLVQKLEG